MTTHSPSPEFTPKTCSVCQAPLSVFQQLPYFQEQIPRHDQHAFSANTNTLYSCGSFECNNILDKKHQMSAPQFAAFFDFQRKCIQKNKEEAALNEKLRLKKIAQCQKENNHLYKNIINTFALRENRYPPLSLPSCWSEEKKVADSRIDDFLQHLRKLLKEATAPDFACSPDEHEYRKKSQHTDELLSSHPSLETLVIQACTVCQGGCCTQGGNHAYLSAGKLHEFMKNQHLNHADEVLCAYKDKIPSDSIENSCLFHTHKGCHLPREMRSDICNGYLCNGLKKIGEDHFPPEPENAASCPDGVVAIVHVQDNWQATDSLEDNPAIFAGILRNTPNT